jgi:hypothetical protein
MEEEEEGVGEVEWMPPRSERESIRPLGRQIPSTGSPVTGLLGPWAGLAWENADDSPTAYPYRSSRLRSGRIQGLRYITCIMAI